MTEPRYRLLETTADVGLLVWGRSEKKLFENAASGLTRVVVSPRSVRPLTERRVRARAMDRESLLVAWLSEWLFLFDAEGFIGRDFDVDEITERHVRGRGRGEALDPGRHILRAGVKGITYHGLEIRQVKDRLRARLVFDV